MAMDYISITDDGTHTLVCRMQRIDILGTVCEIRYGDCQFSEIFQKIKKTSRKEKSLAP